MVVNRATSHVIDRLIMIRGMLVNDFAQNEFVNFQRDAGKYLVNGDIVYREGIAEYYVFVVININTIHHNQVLVSHLKLFQTGSPIATDPIDI